MKKRWKILSACTKTAEALQLSLRINKDVCNILVQRGIDNFDRAKHFFRPQLEQLHDPWLMKDMLKAVKRILAAIKNNEKIMIFGDYDVDGTASVACLYQFLKNIYPHIGYYIPHRYKEGYGVSELGIRHAADHDYSLIISVDCGIKSKELIAWAASLNIDFIVCDHHLPDEELPPATAILNPKQKDCLYPYKELCGCGVVFKLIQALGEELMLSDHSWLQYLDLVATAIAADIVPITGENRILAYYGLKKVNENPCTGIRALLHLAGITKEMFITNLVFIVAPRINAAGRMDDAKKAVQLFIEQDFSKAVELAKLLHLDNSDRKLADSTITEEAMNIIKADESLIKRKTTVVFQDHWHKGVVGIVASRLIESYYRPTIVLTQSGEILAGSARSVSGFNLYEAIHACREHLLGYGGHFAAAGMTLLPEKLDDFCKKFEEVVSASIPEELLTPEITIDTEINFNALNHSFYNIISQMEPFGPENMRPVFITRNVHDTGHSRIVKDQHIRFVVKQNSIIFSGIGFNMAEKFHLLEKKQPLDILFALDMNEWNGEKQLQLKVIDMELSDRA